LFWSNKIIGYYNEREHTAQEAIYGYGGKVY